LAENAGRAQGKKPLPRAHFEKGEFEGTEREKVLGASHQPCGRGLTILGSVALDFLGERKSGKVGVHTKLALKGGGKRGVKLSYPPLQETRESEQAERIGWLNWKKMGGGVGKMLLPLSRKKLPYQRRELSAHFKKLEVRRKGERKA